VATTGHARVDCFAHEAMSPGWRPIAGIIDGLVSIGLPRSQTSWSIRVPCPGGSAAFGAGCCSELLSLLSPSVFAGGGGGGALACGGGAGGGLELTLETDMA